MVVTDLDGTLFQRQQQVSPENLQTLRRLGEDGVLRVIATGRHLFSARKVLSPEFPIDFLIFSTGAGIMDWPAQRLVRSVTMGLKDLRRAFGSLRQRGLDFMVHRPLPDNHYFVYYRSGRENPDFQARLAVYRQFATPGKDGVLPMRRASQFLAVEPDVGVQESVRDLPGPSLLRSLRRDLQGLNVVRTTSPLDGRSRWIEVFPSKVSKSLAAAWLAGSLGVDRRMVLGVGNDFNDLDLLEWAPHGFLVGGAAPELLERFPQVSRGGDDDFSEVVALWEGEALRRRPSRSGRRDAEGSGAAP
jgi:hydroxymethylpyrimidine pyrophosphatase-like HAD family hydrolase